MIYERAVAGLQFARFREDISGGSNWSIYDPARHSMVLHLGGTMTELETELDGHGSIRGPAAQGEVWFIPADQRYASQARGATIDYLTISFPEDFVSLLPCSLDGKIAMQGYLGRFDPFLHQSALRLCEALECDDDLSVLLSSSLSRTIAYHVAAKYQVPAEVIALSAASRELPPAAERRLRDFVYENLDTSIRLSILADVAGMSENQLLVAFRNTFGTTPAQYVLEQRLRRARFLLASSAQTITDIAYLAGFSSHSHLTTAFKNAYGLTPRQFRQGQNTR